MASDAVTTEPKISIIIPTFNEVKTLAATLATTASGNNIETIVVDGGSTDDTVGLARSLGVEAITAPPGRAQQMNLGATMATGEILLFLHADTHLPPDFDLAIRQTLIMPVRDAKLPIAGAFSLRIDAPNPSLRWIERGVSWRSQWLQMPYGDQAIFLLADTFDRVGGFANLPIMEDFELMRRLQSWGYIQTIETPVITSPRRWLKRGVIQTSLINQAIVIGYSIGISPQHLARWYRQPRLNFRQELWQLLFSRRSS